MSKDQCINDFASIDLDLEELARVISDFDFPGENSNQDPCFGAEEDGFENAIYGPDNKMLHGYTVTISLIQNSDEKYLSRYGLSAVVEVFDHDFDGLRDMGTVFSLDSSIENIQKTLLEMIEKELKLFEKEK